MKVIYEADDGTPFDNQLACEDYEGVIAHPAIHSIIFYDIRHKQLDPEDFKDGIFDDLLYQNCWEIEVANDEQVEVLKWLSDYCGWPEFEQIDSPGRWMRFDRDGDDGTLEGEWRQEES